MRRKTFCLVLLAAAVMFASFYRPGTAKANPASGGFKGQTVFKATFDEFEVFNKAIIPASERERERAQVWLSLQKTKGRSDVYVQSNSWPAGASTGWHTHPGHSLIYITDGTVTAYEGPNCTQHIYTKGMTFVDAGGSHAHVIRNESASPATGYAIQIVPENADRRINADPPANCSAIQ